MCHKCYNKKYRVAKKVYPKIKHLPGEEWKFVSELQNEYKISNKGRLMSVNYKGSGYPHIVVLPEVKGYHRLHRKGRNWSIHRLVCKYFVPNPENKPFVNHKNGIRNDNRVENLEWTTPSENLKHAYRTGLSCNKGENHSRSKITDNQAQQIKIMLSKGYSTKDILKEVGGTLNIIYHIKNGTRWKHIKI